MFDCYGCYRKIARGDVVIKNISKLSQLNEFSQYFSKTLKAGDVIYLQGDLGAGKTTFTQLLINNLGYEGRVKSPTYAIYEIYNLEKFNIVHMDLYRIGDPQELYYLALDEIFDGQNIVIIEWPEKGVGVIPKYNKALKFELVNSKKRELRVDVTS